MLQKMTTLQIDVQNFALVTHTVPAERVRPHVPEKFELDTYRDESGREMTFVSANGFCNRQVHWSMARYPAHDFDQLTFRTYVTYRGLKGSYFFGTYVSTRLSLVGQLTVARYTWLADFDLDIASHTAGYPSYVCNAEGPMGTVGYRLEATEQPEAKPPFESGDELSQFISYRLHGFAKHPFGFQTHGPVDHRRMRPWSGRMLDGRFDVWARMGILEPDEFGNVYSVLVEPSVRFTLYPPRPAR